jgi:hypothetical protein
VAEIGVARAGREDQIVVLDFAVGQAYEALGGVDRDGLGQQNADVLLALENAADGVGDIAGGERRRRNLIEQRLEEVVIAAVDDGDESVGVLERAGGVEAGEASADDDDVCVSDAHGGYVMTAAGQPAGPESAAGVELELFGLGEVPDPTKWITAG